MLPEDTGYDWRLWQQVDKHIHQVDGLVQERRNSYLWKETSVFHIVPQSAWDRDVFCDFDLNVLSINTYIIAIRSGQDYM